MLNETATPAFLVDRAIVARNCDAMREKARASGVSFRPHVKTHKTVEIGRMQHGGAAGAITVSTLAEAEYFAADGYRDITYAVPIAPEKLPRAAALAARLERLSVLVDSETALRAIEAYAAAHGGSFDVFLKVDCGYHRAGVNPDDPDSVRLALALARSEAVRFQGLLTHAGHSYNAKGVEEIRRIAAEEAACLTRFRALLASEGIEARRSVGSTPTASVVDRFSECDEVRPGNRLTRVGGRYDRPPLGRDGERLRIGIPAADGPDARPLRREPDRRPDQAGSDDRQALGRVHHVDRPAATALPLTPPA